LARNYEFTERLTVFSDETKRQTDKLPNGGPWFVGELDACLFVNTGAKSAQKRNPKLKKGARGFVASNVRLLGLGGRGVSGDGVAD
jgi:hypothetical protein